MNKRIELKFIFKGKSYAANVLIRENLKGYTYIVNLFEKELSRDYAHSFTFSAIDNEFIPTKPMEDDQMELVEVIKQAIKVHPDNPYKFTT